MCVGVNSGKTYAFLWFWIWYLLRLGTLQPVTWSLFAAFCPLKQCCNWQTFSHWPHIKYNMHDKGSVWHPRPFCNGICCAYSCIETVLFYQYGARRRGGGICDIRVSWFVDPVHQPYSHHVWNTLFSKSIWLSSHCAHSLLNGPCSQLSCVGFFHCIETCCLIIHKKAATNHVYVAEIKRCPPSPLFVASGIGPGGIPCHFSRKCGVADLLRRVQMGRILRNVWVHKRLVCHNRNEYRVTPAQYAWRRRRAISCPPKLSWYSLQRTTCHVLFCVC